MAFKFAAFSLALSFALGVGAEARANDAVTYPLPLRQSWQRTFGGNVG